MKKTINKEKRNKKGSDEKMPRRRRNPLQKAIMAVFGVMIAYTSQYATDPIVKSTALFVGMFVVLYAVTR